MDCVVVVWFSSQDACKVIREFMARDPGEVNFAVTALVVTPPADE
jgi:hypothetical protein